MARAGIAGFNRDATADTRTRRAMRKLTGAPKDQLLDESMDTDDRRRLKAKADTSQNILANHVFAAS